MKILYACLGMMFWYGIEQLFMNDVLRDSSARAAVTIVFTVGMLVLDIPGGIIADKYGRRKALIIGCSLLPVSLVILGLSTNLLMYCVGALTYAVYWSLCNGTVQALVYDHLFANSAHEEYAKHQGSVSAFGYIGAGVANVLSGIIATTFSLRAPYLFSLLPASVALYIAVTTKEVSTPKGSSSRVTGKLIDYYSALINTVKQTPISGVYSLQWIVGMLAFLSIGEFGQVFILAHGASTIQLGILWALVAVASAMALHFAHKLQRYPQQTIFGYVVILLLLCFGATTAGILLFVLFYAWTDIVRNVSETELQHATQSEVRATVLSSVNFIGNLAAIPIIMLFNDLLHEHTRFVATTYVAALLAGVLLASQALHIVYKIRKT